MIQKQAIFKWFLLIVFLSLLGSSGCRRELDCDCEDIIEDAVLELDLTFNAATYTDTVFATYSLPAPADYDMRFIVDVYPDNISSPQLTNRLERIVRTLNQPNNGHNSVKIQMPMPQQKIKVVVWADFVKTGTQTDLFYDATNLAEVKINQPHSQGEGRKAAFMAVASINPAALPKLALVSHEVPLASPFARFKILSLDATKYAQQPGVTPLSQVIAKVSYQLWLPTGYNVFTQEINALRDKVTFTSTTSEIKPESVVIASDYVFISKNTIGTLDDYDSNVTLNFEVYGAGNKMISKAEDINIPLKRGWLTIVKGSCLTKSSGSGVGINDDFESEIDWPID